MEDLRNRLKRETKHAMDNLESLDPLQVGYKELAESIESLMNALHTAELIDCNFAEEPIAEVEVKAEEPIAEVEVKAEETKAEVEVKAEEPIAEVEVKAEEPIAEVEVKAEEEAPQAPITKEELRAVLKECSAIDKALLPELFAQFGAARLSEVKENDYRALYDLAKSKLGEE